MTYFHTFARDNFEAVEDTDSMEDTVASENTIPRSGLYSKSSDLIPVLHTTLNQVKLNDQINITESLIQDDIQTIINVAKIETYCRICGLESDRTNLMCIFEERGRQLELHKKISNHLHLQVEKDDQLPQQICNTCIFHLNISHQLFEISHATDSKLRHIFLVSQMPENSDLCLSVPVVVMSDLDGLQHHEEQHSSENVDRVESTSDKNIFIKAQEQESTDSDKGECEADKNKNRGGKKHFKRNKETGIKVALLCHICGKHSTNLQAHKRTHLAESVKKKHPCSLCPKSFRSKFHLSEHLNGHNGVTPYSCPDCAKSFHKRAQLRQHSQIHAHDSKKVVCEVCGLRFSRRSNLRTHVKIHAENRTFDCRLCHKQFPTFSAMLSHRKQHSQEDIKNRLSLDLLCKERIFTCEMCGKIMTNRDSLVSHLEQHRSGDGSSKHECTDCGKVLRSRHSLTYHQRSQHSVERPFHCSLCSVGFMTKKLQEAHERRHTGEKPFKCATCWKGFRSRNNLSQHILKHSSEKNFECSVCGKRFSRKGALTVHHRKHSGETPFICDICGRPFRQKNDMVKHQNSHLKPNSQSRTCELCMSEFISSKELVMHKDTVHKDNINIVPLIITNNMYETHIITEDGQKIVFTAVNAIDENNLATPSTSL